MPRTLARYSGSMSLVLRRLAIGVLLSQMRWSRPMMVSVSPTRGGR